MSAQECRYFQIMINPNRCWERMRQEQLPRPAHYIAAIRTSIGGAVSGYTYIATPVRVVILTQAIACVRRLRRVYLEDARDDREEASTIVTLPQVRSR